MQVEPALFRQSRMLPEHFFQAAYGSGFPVQMAGRQFPDTVDAIQLGRLFTGNRQIVGQGIPYLRPVGGRTGFEM